jgi:peptidoglycan/LPS O-acetylase OafA/YrhL
MINISLIPHAELTHPKYRADIDGLRAIAVISVVAYHSFPSLIGGGFIGVDIFFVISGFLISTIIFENLQGDRFSFMEFYSRRIKRIFPALIVVLVACLIFGWLVLLPGEYKQLGKHIASGAGFVSNFILWHESGYFDIAAETKPLLHLWTLGIEEQFYILWPLVLWFAWKQKFKWLPIIVTIATGSFALNLAGVNIYPVATFFLPHTRFWELLIGSLLAYVTLYRQNAFTVNLNYLGAWLKIPANITHIDTLNNVVSFAGLSAIVLGLAIITNDNQFPGAWALLPTIGAALIIAGGSQAWVNRVILSNHRLVWFGLISYPLYLWHWPLLSFARIIEGEAPSTNTRITAVAISIVLAWLTFKFIEKPVRFFQYSKSITIILFLIMCIVLAVGLGADKKFLPPRSQNILALQYFDFSGYPTPDGEYLDEKYKFGVLGHNKKNKIVMLGDSHSQQYRNTFATLMASRQSIHTLLPEVMYNLDYLGPDDLLKVSKKLLLDDTIKVVIFSNFWALDYGSDKINYAVRCCGNALGGSVGGNAYHEPLKSEEMDELDSKLLSAALSLIKSGKKVYFVLDNPFGEELAPKNLVSRSIISGVQIKPTPLSKNISLQRDEPIRTRIMNIAKKSGAFVIDPYEYLCNREECPALSDDGIPMYKDYDHLSLYAVTHQVHYLDFLIFN